MSVVVITGASSGIGRALALEWAKRKACVILSARNEVALASVAKEVRAAGGEAIVEAGDVTDDAHRVRLIERAVSEKGALDVLVNNAGRGYYARVRDCDMTELEDLFALNVIAPIRLAQLAMDHLATTRGTIVMMSSVAGVVAVPKLGAYAASKFALEAASMSLRSELAASGVRVCVVRPGPVDTPFRDNSVARNVEAGVRPAGSKIQTPDVVAKQTVRAVERGCAVVETTMFVKGASFLGRHAPGVFRRVGARMAKKE
jgi:short-subunit dehydrogenase